MKEWKNKRVKNYKKVYFFEQKKFRKILLISG